MHHGVCVVTINRSKYCSANCNKSADAGNCVHTAWDINWVECHNTSLRAISERKMNVIQQCCNESQNRSIHPWRVCQNTKEHKWKTREKFGDCFWMLSGIACHSKWTVYSRVIKFARWLNCMRRPFALFQLLFHELATDRILIKFCAKSLGESR